MPKPVEWQPPAYKLVFSIFQKTNDWLACPAVREKTGLGERTARQALKDLADDGEILRARCPCGHGYIYKRATL